MMSDVEIGLKLFQRVNNQLASNRKDRMTKCLFEQLLLRFKRKFGWVQHGQAQKFEAE